MPAANGGGAPSERAESCTRFQQNERPLRKRAPQDDSLRMTRRVSPYDCAKACCNLARSCACARAQCCAARLREPSTNAGSVAVADVLASLGRSETTAIERACRSRRQPWNNAVRSRPGAERLDRSKKQAVQQRTGPTRPDQAMLSPSTRESRSGSYLHVTSGVNSRAGLPRQVTTLSSAAGANVTFEASDVTFVRT